MLLSRYRHPSCYRCVVVVLPSCYRHRLVALSSRYCRVIVVLIVVLIVALLLCYRCVSPHVRCRSVAFLLVFVVVCRFCDVSSVVSSGSFLLLFLCPLCTRFVGIVVLNVRKTVSVQCETVDQGEQDVRRVIKVRFGCFVADVYGAKEVKVFQELTA